jgi:predicted transcriptional regulator
LGLQRIASETVKKLIVSMKSPSDTLSDFKKALKTVRKGRMKEDHFELSFGRKKDFDRFVKNIGLLSTIFNYKPKSIYELAKLVQMDVSNLNKLIVFLENAGAITVKTSIISGRTVKTPFVEYGQIEFDLKAS